MKRIATSLMLAGALAAPTAASSSIRAQMTSSGDSARADPGIVAADNTLQRPAHPEGYVMLIHGGSFLFVGKQYLETEQAAWFRARGWGSYDIDYRASISSIADVTAAYDHLRDTIGPAPAICVQGVSAGGTLALLLAAERPVSCVITQGAIFTFGALAPSFRHGLAWVLRQELWQFSPSRVADKINAPVLMAGSTDDTVVPEAAQLKVVKTMRPQTNTMLLPGSRWPAGMQSNFAHASVTPAALDRFEEAEIGLLKRAASVAQARVSRR